MTVVISLQILQVKKDNNIMNNFANGNNKE